MIGREEQVALRRNWSGRLDLNFRPNVVSNTCRAADDIKKRQKTSYRRQTERRWSAPRYRKPVELDLMNCVGRSCDQIGFPEDTEFARRIGWTHMDLDFREHPGQPV